MNPNLIGAPWPEIERAYTLPLANFRLSHRITDGIELATSNYGFVLQDDTELALALMFRVCQLEDRMENCVEIVRCKDCRHSELLRDSELKEESPWCYYMEHCRLCRNTDLVDDESLLVEDDFYCAYGERRDGGAT